MKVGDKVVVVGYFGQDGSHDFMGETGVISKLREPGQDYEVEVTFPTFIGVPFMESELEVVE